MKKITPLIPVAIYLVIAVVLMKIGKAIFPSDDYAFIVALSIMWPFSLTIASIFAVLAGGAFLFGRLCELIWGLL